MKAFGMDEVTVAFGDRLGLDHVSLEVGRGEVVVVIGGDGAGKTTLCRVMTGLVGVASGTVRRPFDGGVGQLPATSGVWPDLTVTENLAFVATVHRIDPEGSRRRIETLLDRTGLAVARHRLGGQLSGGMRQKLGVAMALLAEPVMLVLDEPTTGVDPVSRLELWRLISEAAAADAAIVLTTTYLDEAERASSVLALEEGRTLARGTPDDVRQLLAGGYYTAPYQLDLPYRWRRGASWRAWVPDGSPAPPGAHPVEPDLADVLTASALIREAGERS
ncbi:MAG: ATP-binding cassette domain-containing protein [Actinomycetota bacterium]